MGDRVQTLGHNNSNKTLVGMGSNSRTLSNSMGLVLQGQTIAIMAKEWIMVEVMAEVVHEIAIPTLIKILRVMVEVVLILEEVTMEECQMELKDLVQVS